MRARYAIPTLLLAVLAISSGFATLWRGSPPWLGARVDLPQSTGGLLSQKNPMENELAFPVMEVDLGIIKEPTQHVFEYENKGHKPIEILAMKSSCSCTALQPDKRVVQPGEKGVIAVTVHPRAQAVGSHLYAIEIEYRGTSLQYARLVLRAQIRPDVVLPDDLTIRSVYGRVEETYFTLTDFRDRPLQIRRITTSTDKLKVEIVEKPRSYSPGWQYRLKAVYEDNHCAPGSYTESIVLRTSDPEREAIVLKVVIERMKRLRVIPETLFLTEHSNQRSEVSGTIFVDDTEGSVVEIESVTPSDESLQCTIEVNRSPRPKITVRLDKTKLLPVRSPLSVQVRIIRPVKEEASVKVSPTLHTSSP